MVHARVASPSPGISRRTTADSDSTSRSASGGSVTGAGAVARGAQHAGERLAQLVEPLPGARDGRHHRHAQVGGQAGLVDGQPLRACLVDHVEGDHRAAPVSMISPAR